MVDATTRELVSGFNEEETIEKDLFLSFVDTKEALNKPYKLYIATTDTYAVDEPPAAPQLQLATVNFQLIVNQEYETKVPSSGWLYLFLNGKLWREINIKNQRQYADVNLFNFQGLPEGERLATCSPRDHIVIPVAFEGTPYSVQVAYSKVQWSWHYIEQLGGLDSKATRLNTPDANELRDKRCTELDYFNDKENTKDPFSLSSKQLHEFQTPTETKQDIQFSIPSWLDMAADIQAEHDAALGAIESLITVQTEDTGYYPKDHVDRVRIALLLNQHYLYGNQKANFNTLAQAIKQSNFTQYDGTYSTEKLARAHECLDLAALERTLQTQRFEALVEEALNAKHKIISLLGESRFVAMLSDYASLGTEQKSADRIQGLLALGEVFEGFTIDPMQQVEPFLVDYYKYEQSEYWHLRQNPIPEFLEKLTGLSETPHPLFEVTFNFAQLYPELWQEFQKNNSAYQNTPIEEMTYAQRYNPNISGIGDQLEELHGVAIANQLIKQLLKLMAGFVAVDESKLDSWAVKTSSKDIRAKLVDTDGYDDVIQKRKKEIESLEKERTTLEGQREPLNKKITELSAKIDGEKIDLDIEMESLSTKLSEYQKSKPTEAELNKLKEQKVSIAIHEQKIAGLKVEKASQQRLLTQNQLSIAEINTTIRTQKQYQTQRQANQNTPVYSQRVSGQLTEGSSTKNHLFMGEASQFIAGKRIAKVKVDLQDIIDGNFPAHLSPLNKPAIKALQQRLKSGFQQLHTQGGKTNNVNALGINFPVSANALNGDRTNIDLALNQLAAAMLDTKNKVPAHTVDMYCLKADIDITLSEKNWSTLQRKSTSDALYLDYLNLNKGLELTKTEFQKQQKILAQQKQKLEHISAQRIKVIDQASSYQQKNHQLMLKDQRIHSFQVKFQGGVAAFEVYNMALKWRALVKNPSNKAWMDASLASIELAGSLVDTFESGLRSFSPTSKTNYHQHSKSFRRTLRWVGRGLGIAGGFIAIHSGYQNVIAAKALSDNARLWGGVTEIASGVMSIISISLITISGLTKVAFLATLGFCFGLGALALGLVSLAFVLFYEDEDGNFFDKVAEKARKSAQNRTESKILKMCTFGIDHNRCTETEGLEDWQEPTKCYAGLRSFFSQPQIKISADHNIGLVKIAIQNSALEQNHNTNTEVYIRGDENYFSNDGIPWQSLYTQTVLDRATQPDNSLETKLSSNSKTYGVDYNSLARNISVNLQSGVQTLSIPIALFKQMSEQSRCDDFYFRVLVRGIPKVSNGIETIFGLPRKFANLSNLNSDLEVSRVDQEHFYQHSNSTWWYLAEKQIDLI
ncbi:hypothetical protein [Reinekea sp.]|jgi:hypothetical protein|uniref:hypothetical protein n=1 Tax=Reinekea sp. TaxID=1970455 RepID=UPI003988FA95